MDNFITIKKTKKNIQNNAFIGNSEAVEALHNAINNKKNIILYGTSGTGKSFIINLLLKNNYVEITSDILRSKNSTLDFLEKLRYSTANIVIDDLDCDLLGTKEIIELIGNGIQITKGCFIIISQFYKNINNCEEIELKKLSINQLVNLGRISFPKKHLPTIIEFAKKSRGNIRNFLTNLEFSNTKDIFKTPKQMIYDLTCSDVKYPETPDVNICKKIHEHGYSWGIIHENYVDAPNIENCYSTVADYMSIADTIDNKIYEGHWEYSEYFSLYGIVIPAMKINHELCSENMRPGSSWTKYSNYKMRMAKFKALTKTPIKITIEHVYGIQHHLLNDDISMALTYKLEPQDLDVINHLCIKNKLKPKNLLKLKSRLKHEMAKNQ
ncbi:hypothetical protein N9C10_03505 [Flavobacteriaceae bacterium]|nr:hypothetical protein [Flavobacteriaceae bacterium]